MITAHIRGHAVSYYDELWRYIDTGEPSKTTPDRACVSCGRQPTREGYDPCIGYIRGAKSVCCGHGVHRPVIMLSGARLAELDRLPRIGGSFD